MRIDVHNHILPPAFMAAVGSERIGSLASSGRPPEWSVAQALDAMDLTGLAAAVTSVSAPGFLVDDPASVPDLARRCNVFAAEMARDHPGRFGLFAGLPLPQIDATLAEIEHAYDDLAADGVCMLSNYGGLYLGDARFGPVFEELDRRAAVVFVHPTAVSGAPLIAGLSQSTLEFPFDTTRTLASLLFGGVMSRFRAVRFIFSHAGGAAPYLAQRMELLSGNAPHLRAFIPDGVMSELRRHYYDTALSANASAFGALRQLAPIEHILFGTDFPYGPRDQIAGTIRGLQALGLSDIELASIERDNALALLPRLARG